MHNTNVSPSVIAGKQTKGRENKLIYSALSGAQDSLTRREISNLTGIEIPSLCRALGYLVKVVHTVEISRYGICNETGKNVMHYSLKNKKAAVMHNGEAKNECK